MDGWSAFFFVLLMTVLFSAGTVGIFAAFHIIYQSRATPLERRLWGISTDPDPERGPLLIRSAGKRATVSTQTEHKASTYQSTSDGTEEHIELDVLRSSSKYTNPTGQGMSHP